MTFDSTKPVQTRDGREARIICDNAQSPQGGIIALITDEEDFEHVCHFRASGQMDGANKASDLINIPEGGWVTLWKDGSHSITPKRPEQEELTYLARACIPFTEGQGL